MNHRLRWRVGALASAIALLGSLTSLDAQALGLGRMTVQSALGEPLKAEIDISEISADEAGSLKAGVANAEAFKAAGLEYTPAVVGVQVSLQKRADGRSYLRLSSSRPITEPFVDLILEASWSSGRIVRDYTMLFDPPNLRQSGMAAAPIAPVAPILSRPAAPAAPATALTERAPYSPPPAERAPSAIRPAPVARAAPPAKASPAPKAPASGQQVAVKQGDTAGKIAAQNKPASVSLDQMLVALLRSNPDAFIGGNINRLKSGAVLDLPGADEAGAISAGEASRTVVAQARDFNEFRRKLAEGVPTTQVGSANRQAGGKVQAKVEDRAPTTATPDKLTLSKGAVQGKPAAEDQIAKDRQVKAASDRVAELSKNINDLNKLAGAPAGAATGAAAAASAAGVAVTKPGALPATPATAASAAAPASIPASASKAISTGTPALAAASAPAALSAPPVTSTAAGTTPTTAAASGTATAAALAPASAAPAASASAPVAAASQAMAAATAASTPVAAVVAKKPVVIPPPPPEPGLIDELTENPLVLPAFAGLLLLLGGFGYYRYKKRNNAVQVDSSFLESRLQPDSFFGASGGQRIDTSEGGATGSSLVYSPSQLDAAGDVDPVAEADVYLAYGRDLQAEEILKEAMRTSPTRVAIHAKLMEIYAKRRDAKAFEVVAIEAFNLTRGEGPEWAYIGEMGRELDPANPMYQPGGQPQVATRGNATEAQQAAAAAAFGASTIPQMIEPEAEAPAASVDFDLDLDFSLGDEPVAAAPPPPAVATAPAGYRAEPTLAMNAHQDPVFDGLDMDFSTEPAVKPTAKPPSANGFDANAGDMALSASGLSFTADAPVAVKPAPAPAPVASVPDSGMLEFDLGSLSLDLNGPTTESPALSAPTAASGDPLETKFALAEEFRALGDMDGARSLAEEVAAHSTGSLKSKAQAFINALS
ncbi:FimV/HubP family polar landmark protein [Polaromonas sp.]|uniref:FimV/HubP family polar landmark protein n=1 Tax=Polaromonas sp. TaxID=1869339 RepID=UPI003BAC3088